MKCVHKEFWVGLPYFSLYSFSFCSSFLRSCAMSCRSRCLAYISSLACSRRLNAPPEALMAPSPLVTLFGDVCVMVVQSRLNIVRSVWLDGCTCLCKCLCKFFSHK